MVYHSTLLLLVLAGGYHRTKGRGGAKKTRRNASEAAARRGTGCNVLEGRKAATLSKTGDAREGVCRSPRYLDMEDRMCRLESPSFSVLVLVILCLCLCLCMYKCNVNVLCLLRGCPVFVFVYV